MEFEFDSTVDLVVKAIITPLFKVLWFKAHMGPEFMWPSNYPSILLSLDVLGVRFISSCMFVKSPTIEDVYS